MNAKALWLLPLLAACSGPPERTAEPSPTPTVAAPKVLVAADFDPASIGAKIDFRRGSDLEDDITADGRTIGSVLAYVACPQGATECVPADMPAGTLYTYVVTITPKPPALGTAEPAPDSVGASDTPTAGNQAPPVLLRTTQRTVGFNGGVGYSRSQALAALGDEDAITVSVDSDQLIWRVTAGSGWMPGMPITFWWQSSVPPTGYQSAYRLELDSQLAKVTAPFPAPSDTPSRPG